MPLPYFDTIIFDLGGVLLDLDAPRTENALRALGAEDLHEYFRVGFAASFFREFEIGTISPQEFLQSLKKMIGKEVPDEKLIEAWNTMLLRIPPERVDLLQFLSRKYRLFLFSNTNAIHYDRFKQDFRRDYAGRDLDEYFEGAYYSHLVGLRKPDRNCYQWLIDRHNLQPEATLFVDDALPNVEGAAIAGLQSFWLEPGRKVTEMDWPL